MDRDASHPSILPNSWMSAAITLPLRGIAGCGVVAIGGCIGIPSRISPVIKGLEAVGISLTVIVALLVPIHWGAIAGNI